MSALTPAPAPSPARDPSPDPHLPATPLRLAAVQAESVPGDVAGNAVHAAGLVGRAAAAGARVAVLPELQVGGYDLAALAAGAGEVAADAAGIVDDPRLDALRDAAVRDGIHVITGAAVRRPDGALTNSVLVADPAGTLLVRYDKQHLWHADEARLFTPGRGGAAVEVGGWRLGLGVCYDMSFPEHARSAALAGAHAYLCPSAYAAGNEHRAAVYLAARALENTVYSVFVNPVGGPADRPCAGGSLVFAPDSTPLARAATPAREQVLTADLDPGAIARVRGFLHMLAEHRAALPRPAPTPV
ncbi:carbon-nitrogen hydrolase family protein [Streptomyces sp. NPDC012888]|uniref:carbon-nitrogen hydrolase family protein n=1 Tax=Streptomyces sp. NPDC012888 TaxID=3364855 RepID=UPI0036CE7CC1